MTASTPISAAETLPHMANTPETAPPTPTEQTTPPQARTTARAKPTLRAQVAENPLLSFFGLVIVALLAASIAGPNIRINDTNRRIDDTNRRIDRLEDTMLAGFAALDTKIDTKVAELDAKIDAKFGELDNKIDALDAKFDEMNLKLTALITHLNAADAVNNALEGRLADEGGRDAADSHRRVRDHAGRRRA